MNEGIGVKDGIERAIVTTKTDLQHEDGGDKLLWVTKAERRKG
jgi:hypothetical protein